MSSSEPIPGYFVDPLDPAAEVWWDGVEWDYGRTRPRAEGTPEFPAPPTPAPLAYRLTGYGQAASGNPSAQPNSTLLCPHCGTQGQVTVSRVKRKKGIDGTKAAAAVVTAGWSTLLTGLSRKESVTHMRCANCRTEWDV